MTDWTPDDKTARTFKRYRDAHTTERQLKPTVQELAVEALKAGATITQLSERTGIGVEVFRRMARKHEIPINERYQERAARLRARASAPVPPSEPAD